MTLRRESAAACALSNARERSRLPSLTTTASYSNPARAVRSRSTSRSMVASLLYTGTRIDRRGAAAGTGSAGRLPIGPPLGWQVVLFQRRRRLREEAELLPYLIADAGEIHSRHRPRD